MVGVVKLNLLTVDQVANALSVTRMNSVSRPEKLTR